MNDLSDDPSPDTVEEVPTRIGYDRWAVVYDGEDNPLVLLEEQHLGALVGDVAGLDVADIGCGTGRHALRLATAGARVTAPDRRLRHGGRESGTGPRPSERARGRCRPGGPLAPRLQVPWLAPAALDAPRAPRPLSRRAKEETGTRPGATDGLIS